MRVQYTFESRSIAQLKQRLLAWSQQFKEVVWLDSNDFQQQYSSYDAVLATDAFTSIKTQYRQAFSKLKDYQTTTKDWLFGYFTYDLKNDIEILKSNNYDGLEFPELYFFQPKRLFLIKGNTVTVRYLKFYEKELMTDVADIQKYPIVCPTYSSDRIRITGRISKEDYLEKVQCVLSHIRRGDIYEANFCQEFYAENVVINPLEVYKKLNTISRPPFATFLKLDSMFLLSASPERYLKKEGNRIITQPIKGTARRSTDVREDEQLKVELLNDGKERSENIMIVDLVRNDLSKTATKGSVKVEELCEIYSFKQVHQMISTLVSTVKNGTHPVDIITSTFPMGSMTGAPKLSAMHIIEKLEETKRGLYSGALGYFSPENNFDFNVIIRSILYNKSKRYVSYSVGSAITAKSSPDNEYNECLIKAKAMRHVLEN